MAKSGDWVLVTGGRFRGEKGRVSYSYKDGNIAVDIRPDNPYHILLQSGEYRLLDSGEPKSAEEILANLALRMTKIERKLSELDEQVDSNTKDIRTIGEEVVKADHKIDAYRDDYLAVGSAVEELGKDVEMIIDDIAMLDERTQCLTEQGIEQLAKDLVGLINERMRSI